MKMAGKEALKELLGEVPLTAELYWLVRQRGRPIQSRFSLKRLQTALPAAVAQAQPFAQAAPKGKRVFIFATLHYWIEHAAMLGVSLAGMGHKVTLGYLPYAEWQSPINKFDLRRQNIYARRVLEQASPLINAVSMLDMQRIGLTLPPELASAAEQVATYDTQYTLQLEDFDRDSEIYRLRLQRDQSVAQSALVWLRAHRPDVVIVPNGTIQELGMIYRVARTLHIPVVTYEFGEQRERIWLAQNREIMRQDTDGLWTSRQGRELGEDQIERLQALFAARQKGQLVENFARLWQGTPAQGAEQARAALGLDERPVVLLPTNVIGDSLTLGRQVFSHNMTEWITRTVQYFAGMPEVQLVIRIHPGEILSRGASVADIVHQLIPHLPEHIHLIGAREKVNTYDLAEVADLGLVYTTTVGMEMAMMGVPVIVAGQTHYRGRGFTYDPDSWVSYFKQLGQMLSNPASHRLTREQIERAWKYAYSFFFEFPRPFPWHLVRMWDDVEKHPMAEVLSKEGQEKYGDTFRFLTGEPIDWKTVA